MLSLISVPGCVFNAADFSRVTALIDDADCPDIKIHFIHGGSFVVRGMTVEAFQQHIKP